MATDTSNTTATRTVLNSAPFFIGSGTYCLHASELQFGNRSVRIGTGFTQYIRYGS
jgi:hypothetical protein